MEEDWTEEAEEDFSSLEDEESEAEEEVENFLRIDAILYNIGTVSRVLFQEELKFAIILNNLSNEMPSIH